MKVAHPQDGAVVSMGEVEVNLIATLIGECKRLAYVSHAIHNNYVLNAVRNNLLAAKTTYYS